jgi:PTS system mannose-specific IIA component
MDKKREDIKSAISKLNSGKGVVLLTDLFGGTPSNLAISVMEPDKTEVIAGLNLPMLIKLCSVRNTKDLKEAVEEAKTAGQKYISIASSLL